MLSEEKFNKRFDELLGAVNKGFQAMEDRFQGLEGKFQGLEERLGARMDRVEFKVDRIEKIVDKWPAPSTIDDLRGRVWYIEKKLDIKPGDFRTA